VKELQFLLDKKNTSRIIGQYNKIIDVLGSEGASERAAKAISLV
jgi:hypothetical protein